MGTSETWADIGDRVREAREAAGFTQGELASVMGVERTALVRVESGQRHLNAMELFRISDAVGVPVAHFVTPPPFTRISRRQSASGRLSTVERAHFKLDVALEAHARDTQWLVEQGTLHPPSFPPLGVDDPKELARNARTILRVGSDPLGQMSDVAECLGLYLTVVDVDGDGASAILGQYGVTVIGSAADLGRRRWTAAHEIGHYLFCDEYTAEVGDVSTSRDEREQRIDAFAGEFILPEKVLADELAAVTTEQEVRDRLVALAAAYRISWSAIVARARHCGLLTASAAQWQHAHNPVRGDFLAVVGREPVADLEPGEHGPQWKQAVFAAYNSGLITAARAAELIGDLTVDDIPDRITS